MKLVWSREEEFTWAYARPAGVIDVRSGVTRGGRLVFWEFDNYNSGGGYRVPRFSDVPPLEAVLIDRRDEPSAGAGETPIVALPPAVGNALFRATGVRLRSLPLAPSGIKGV